MRTYQAVGKSVRLRDGREKVAGRAPYAADISLPGMLHARLVLSPHAHARILSIDTRRARAVPGVVAVVTAADLGGLGEAPASRSQILLAADRVVFAGHPVAVVLAGDEATAQDAAALVEVTYEPLAAAVEPVQAMEPCAPLVWPSGLGAGGSEAGIHGGDTAVVAGGSRGRATNINATIQYRRGDVEAGFRDAKVVVERHYRTGVVHQGYLEPHATVAAHDPLTGVLTIWTATQGQFLVRAEVAQVLGIGQGNIRVIPTAIGGGFGGKIVLVEPLVAALAMKTSRPVRLVLTRMEEFLTSTPAPQILFDLRMGAASDGSLTAIRGRVVYDTGAFPTGLLSLACLILGWSYRCPHLDIEGVEVLTHKTPAGAYRAPAGPSAVFAMESHMDDLARALGLDAVEFRLRNVVDGGDPMPDGTPWPPLGLRACLERLRDHPDWRQREQRRRPYEGVGIALTPWRGGIEPAAAVCRVDDDGGLHVVVGSVDLTGTHTTLALIAAEAFGVPERMVRVVQADTQHAPYAGVAGGSKITTTVGLAVQHAAAEARQQVLQIAAECMEARPDDLEIVDGWVRVRGVPDRRVFIGDIARMTMQYGGRFPPIFGRGAVAPQVRSSGSAVHFARVAVDPETGEVRGLRYVALQDVGFAINPKAIQGQIHGGVAQGVGWALLERMMYDERGQPVTATLMDYALPSAVAVPPIDVELIEVPLPHTPFGARGVGEPPVVPVAAAIANAIYDAVGVRVTRLPVTPEALLAAMGRKGHGPEATGAGS
ncbi:MAG: xanthine dehydrogenase family protein molybdopterin-binding subunit [Armatimonadetes bacterium]|nr:xanthine dehydrogenase family protein molybdopterin-binding subunit [Armatimonadota bacterium]